MTATQTTTLNQLTATDRTSLESDLREERDNLQRMEYDAANLRANGQHSARLEECIALAYEVVSDLKARLAALDADATATGSDGDSGDAGVMTAPAFPIGARVYMRYGETVYRAEVLEYDAERDCYTVLYHNIAYKCLMHGHAVAPERLTLAEARWQPAHVLATVAA